MNGFQTHDPNDHILRPIGMVRCAFQTSADIPIEGGPAIIEVQAEYADGLEGIDRGTHIVVLSWLHLADRSILKARPRKLDPSAPSCGVFASRAPVRPNPIGLTVVRLLSRNGNRLSVEPLDLIDGTPVLDIKSYVPGWDCVFSARRERRVPQNRLMDRHLLAFLERELRNHMGSMAAQPAARIALAATFVAIRHLDVDVRDTCLRIETNRLDAGLDALMGLTGALLSEGRLMVRPESGPRTISFTLGGRNLYLTVVDEDAFSSDPADWSTRGFVARATECAGE